MEIILLLYVWFPVFDYANLSNSLCRSSYCSNLSIIMLVRNFNFKINIEKTINGGGEVSSSVEAVVFIYSYSQFIIL